MKNLTEYGDFKNKKRGIKTSELNEGAQLFDATWKVRTRVEIPTSLINAYIKKVQQETGENTREKWSDQELAEEITKYVTVSYLTIENLPVSIVSNAQAEPKIQTQEEMPAQTQVQEPQVQVQTEPAPQAEVVAQTVPQGQVQTPAPQGQGSQEI